MKFYNLKENDQQVSFAGAVKQGLGRNQGLFFPETLPRFDNIEALLALPLVERSVKVLYPFVSDDLTEAQLTDIVTEAFNFPAQIQPISEQNSYQHSQGLKTSSTLENMVNHSNTNASINNVWNVVFLWRSENTRTCKASCKRGST